MNKLTKSLFLLFFITLTGCAVPISESGYYWGDYSSTYYAYLKNPSKEESEAHFASLVNIIDISKEKGLTPAPGIYAEMGYFKQKQGKTQEAENYFAEELKHYPESEVFIGKLYKKEK